MLQRDISDIVQMPHGGIKDVTEECFQQNPLEFEGDDQWVVYRSQEDIDISKFDFLGPMPILDIALGCPQTGRQKALFQKAQCGR